jgi:ssDNA thymidine ADP-ribosyltransferase, DarT
LDGAVVSGLNMSVPDRPRIYHIVHVDNLASIVTDGCLWPDKVMAKRKGAAVIGNNEIKADRLLLPVGCHPGTRVADYIPFYFCPHSVMLYVIDKGNHPNVSYRDGQDHVVHLLADMYDVVEWASSAKRKWAFTDINAANRAADFYNDLSQLNQLDWEAIATSSGSHAGITRWQSSCYTRVFRGSSSAELERIPRRWEHECRLHSAKRSIGPS